MLKKGDVMMDDRTATCVPDPADENSPEKGGQDLDSTADNAAGEDLNCLITEEPVSDRVEELFARLKAQDRRLDELLMQTERATKSLEQVKVLVETLANEHAALVSANEQLDRLSALHWEERVIEPLASQIFPVFDLALGYRAASRRKPEKSHEIDSALKAVQNMLQEFLGTYGIEFFLPRKGAKFDSSSMKAMKVTCTRDQSMNNRVQGCLQAGFRRGRRVLRPASVVLWRCEKPDQPHDDSNERRV